MGKWSEKLHPRGRGGKFAKKGSSGASAKTYAKATAGDKDGQNRGYNRKERAARVKVVNKNLKAAGANRRTRRGYKTLQRKADLGHVVEGPNGQVMQVHPRDRRKAAAHNRSVDLAHKKSSAKKSKAKKKR